MANGAVCSRMYTQLVMTFRHPFNKGSISKAKVTKIVVCGECFDAHFRQNMAQVDHFLKNAPLIKRTIRTSVRQVYVAPFLEFFS